MPLDRGIRYAVNVLQQAGVETFESCQGGSGHTFAEPTVRFHGDREEGFRALAAALERDLPVAELRRSWQVIDGEPCGPHWEMTFYPAERLLALEQQAGQAERRKGLDLVGAGSVSRSGQSQRLGRMTPLGPEPAA